MHTFHGWAFPLPLWHNVVLIDPGHKLVPLEGREQLVVIGVSVGIGIIFGVVFVVLPIVARTLKKNEHADMKEKIALTVASLDPEACSACNATYFR